jgi:hypothetical protein
MEYLHPQARRTTGHSRQGSGSSQPSGTPCITTGTGELGEASFVTIDTTARDAIAVSLSKQRTNFAPTIVRVSKSGKDFSEHSMYPTLGVDTTLPQYRADSVDAKFVPTQNQYPVWYFFYGNLAVPDIPLSAPRSFGEASIHAGHCHRGRYQEVEGQAQCSARLRRRGNWMRQWIGISYRDRGARGGTSTFTKPRTTSSMHYQHGWQVRCGQGLDFQIRGSI